MNDKVLKISEELFNEKLYTRQNIRQGRERNKTIINLIKKIMGEGEIKEKGLDAGCGDGMFALAFKRAFKIPVLGVDMVDKALNKARKKGIIVKKGNIETRIPFPNEYFSVVTLVEVIEHLYDPDAALEEVWRVLKKEGILILSTPNLAAWYNRVLLFLGIQPFFLETSLWDKTVGLGVTRRFTSYRQPLGHLRLFTKGAITDLLRLHNFQILKLAAFPLFALPKMMLIADKFISKIPSLGSTFLVIAKKQNKQRNNF